MNILLGGDSTVTDQPKCTPYDFALCYCGWGQMLHCYFPAEIKVYNYAVSGYTVDAFRAGEDSRYAQLCRTGRPGDPVLLQFGHNDEKLPELGCGGGYSQGLAAYIRELRAIGLVPVIVTPLCRNSWRGDNGAYNDLLAPYAQCAADVAAAYGAPLLDLHGMSRDWFLQHGREGVKRYFYPGDYTHPNDMGGRLFAGMIAKLILDSTHPALQPLRDVLLPEAQWPCSTVADSMTDPVTGWIYPPQARWHFDFLLPQAPVTNEQALRMAREGGGYFVSVHTGAQGSEREWYCALENGYLPEGFPDVCRADEPARAEDIRRCLLLSMAGRYAIRTGDVPQGPEAGADGTVSGDTCARFASALEKGVCRCADTPAQTEKPAGS